MHRLTSRLALAVCCAAGALATASASATAPTAPAGPASTVTVAPGTPATATTKAASATTKTVATTPDAAATAVTAAAQSRTSGAELHSDDISALERQANDAILAAVPRDAYAAAVFQGSGGALPYRLLPPANVEPGRRYPLVVVLHGSGAVGTDNARQLGTLALSWSAPALRQRYPAYILVPQFAQRSANYAPSAVDGILASQPGPGVQTLLELIASLQTSQPLDADRLYISGFSMGASAAVQAALQQPTLFAGVVAFSGIAPERARAPELATLPMLLVHGDADTDNPIAADRAFYAALRQAGAVARLQEFQGMEHMVPASLLMGTDWRDWLFTQRR